MHFSRRKSVVFSALILTVVLGASEMLLRAVGLRRAVPPRLILRAIDIDISFPFMRPDTEAFWTPRPGYQGTFQGTRVSINALGLRAPEIDVPKPPDRRRLVCFGDSITFGYGVDDDQTYAARLGRLLAAQRMEVVNAGVTGYTSHQVRVRVSRVVPAVDADFVTVCIGWNDGTLRPASDREYAGHLRRTAAVDGLFDRLYLYRGLKNLYLRRDVKRLRGVPRQTRRVAPEHYRENLEHVVRFCRQRGTRIALVALPRRKRPDEVPAASPYPELVRSLAAEWDVPLLEVGDLDGATTLPSNASYFIDTLHFSPEGHALLARELARQLAALGWV